MTKVLSAQPVAGPQDPKKTSLSSHSTYVRRDVPAAWVDREAVRNARDALIHEGLLSRKPDDICVPHEIDRSWRRSIGSGASYESNAFRYVNDFDLESDLYRAASPVLDRLHENLHDMGVALFLSDPSGQIVARRVADRTDRDRFDRAHGAEGFSFSEDNVGTNGLGTAMQEKQAIFVRGTEHFNEVLEGLACTGMSIRHPITGRVLGALALACAADSADLLMLAMTREATQQIVRNLGERASHRDLALNLNYQKHRSGGPVIVLNSDTVMTNVAGLPFINTESHARMWDELLGQDWTRGPHRLDFGLNMLPGQVLAHRLADGDDNDPSFAVEIVALETPTRQNARNSAHALTTSTEGVARGLLLQDQLDDAGKAQGAIAVLGPGGSGKLHSTLAWLRRHSAPEPLVLDSAILGATTDWFDAAESAISAGTCVLIRHAEDLDLAHINKVKALDSFAQKQRSADQHPAPTSPRVILTLDPRRCLESVNELLAQIAIQVETAPLSADPKRVADLIAAIMSSIEPSSRVTFTSAALQALMRWNWPGNVGELSCTLQRLSAERPGSLIQLEHLPPHLQATSRRRTLSRMESVERDEIVAALAQAQGNRSQAADALGMGRTTLYRKIRIFGIDASEQMDTKPHASRRADKEPLAG